MPLTQITPEGQAAAGRIAEFRQNINNGATPAQARATVGQIQSGPVSGYNINLPPTIPQGALASQATPAMVMQRRSQMEQTQQIMGQYDTLGGQINAPAASVFSDPDTLINRLLLNRTPTGTEMQRDAVFGQQMQNASGYSQMLGTARTQANDQFGIPELQARLTTTREQFAERENRLTTDLKNLELNAERRGVSREFVEAEKNKIKSDALQDLANLATIEKAQSGSLQEARALVDDIIADKKTAFELENQQLQAQLNYLNTKTGEEAQDRASLLSVALNERRMKQEKILSDEKTIRDLIVDVASNGGDEATLAGMNGALKAGNVEEAFRMAGPWLGRMDRLQLQASMAASGAAADAARTKNLIELAKMGNTEAMKALGLTGSPTEQEYQLQSTDIQWGISQVESALKNTTGLNLLTGYVQSPLLAAAGQAVGGGTAAGAVGGSLIPGVGTAIGALGGAAVGLATTPFLASSYRVARDEAKTAIKFLVADSTFQEVVNFRAQGVTFGNMTEGERKAAGDAANALNAAVVTDPQTNELLRINASPDQIKIWLQDLGKAYSARQEYLDRKVAVTADEESEARAAWNE